MTNRPDTMRHPQALIAALEGVNATPPKVLQNITSGFELLGDPVQRPTADPANAILAAAVDGKLTSKSLDELLSKAAAESTTNGYRQDFRLKADRKFAHRFHDALLGGAADEVLDGLRPQFEAVAAELGAARDAVDLNATPQRLLDVTATPGEQDAWRRLPELVRQINRLGAIAAAFGPQADLAVVDNLTRLDTLLHLEWIDDRALMATEGNLVNASNAFRAANPNWQTSPWLRVTPKLATITEAQDRYRQAAEEDFGARVSLRAGRGTLTEQGFIPDILTNPHAIKETVDA
jgi:hypothetical protein